MHGKEGELIPDFDSSLISEGESSECQLEDVLFLGLPRLPEDQYYTNEHFNDKFNILTKKMDIKPTDKKFLKASLTHTVGAITFTLSVHDTYKPMQPEEVVNNLDETTARYAYLNSEEMEKEEEENV